MQKITEFFTEVMRRYLPDPFVFAIGLTLLTMVLALLIEGKGVIELTTSWGNGFWSLLAFTTQMAVILAMGYVLATAPLTERFPRSHRGGGAYTQRRDHRRDAGGRDRQLPELGLRAG